MKASNKPDSSLALARSRGRIQFKNRTDTLMISASELSRSILSMALASLFIESASDGEAYF